MSLWRLALKSLWNRRLSMSLAVFAIATSTALLLTLEHIRHASRTSFMQTVSGVDLIVGARGGGSQLLLYSVFRLGEATQNFSWESFEKLAALPQVSWAIPVSLGDSHRGFRVLATDQRYFRHYRTGEQQALSFAQGSFPGTTFDVVLGSDVADKLNYRVGDRIVLSHGIAQNALSDHADHPFVVTGVLQATGTPVDRTLHISLAGMEAIHLDWDETTGHAGAAPPPEELVPTSITAAFVGLHSPMMAFTLQRGINNHRGEALMAILPGVALSELWQGMALMEQVLLLVSGCVVIASLLGLLAVMLTSLNERRRELAILRAIGAGGRHVHGLLLLECGIAGLAGAGAGLAIFYGLLIALRPWLATEFGLFLPLTLPSSGELAICGGVVLAALLTGLLPAWRAMRDLVGNGLAPRI